MYSLPLRRLVAHCNKNTHIAEAIGTPIASGKLKIRRFKVVVTNERINTTVSTWSTK